MKIKSGRLPTYISPDQHLRIHQKKMIERKLGKLEEPRVARISAVWTTSELPPDHVRLDYRKTYVPIARSIGDLLLTKAFLDPIATEKDPLRVCQGYPKNGTYRYPAYNVFAEDLCEFLLPSTRYIHLPSETCDYESGLQPMHFPQILNVPFIVPDMANELALPCKIPSGEYIVINTKTRILPRLYYEECRPLFLKMLSKLSEKYHILLLGDRDMGLVPEYNRLNIGENVFCIYRDLKEALPMAEDLTLDTFKDMKEPPSWENIREDMYRMAHAKTVIQFGGGGQYCMALAVKADINVLFGKYTNCLIDFLEANSPSHHTFHDLGLFLDRLGSL